jgi:hypothetical protein
MARGDVLLVGLPDSDKREEKGNRPAIRGTNRRCSFAHVDDCPGYIFLGGIAVSVYCKD